jgi:hypothetical protein
MKSTNKIIFVILIFYTVHVNAQEYRVGTSSCRTEPEQSLISLHLGGYGGPREGRFSLQWVEKELLPVISFIGGVSDKLYIISKGELLWRRNSENIGEWKTTSKVDNIIAITGLNGKLYAVNNDGELLETMASKIKWERIMSVDKSVACLTASGDKLYIANKTGDIKSMTVSTGNLNWTKVIPINGLISLAANGDDLYGLTDEGVIYKCKPGRKDARWIKAAYKNRVTIKEDIKHIAFAGNIIYGVDNNNKLYEGEHRSDNNLTARAMAIKNGEKTVLILTVDVCGLNDTYSGVIKKEIYERYKIPASAVFINSSHTHFAPVSQNWFTWQEPNQIPDSTYIYSILKNGILNAVDNAIEKMAPAQLFLGRGKADLGFNRSLKDHPELYDNAVDVLKVKYSDNTESYLFLAACHAVHSTAGKLHYTISANFPGVARNLVEERTGTSDAIFLQGTAGDINPKDNGAYITGEKLSNEVISVLSRQMTEIKGAISFYLDTINIPIKPWPKEEILALKAAIADKIGDVSAEKDIKWCDLMLKHYDNGTMPVSMPVYINTLNIGNWKLIGFSRETTTEYGLGVKKLWPDKLISVTGYTNDVSSYLPTTLHIKARNYEGYGSFFWYGMPNTFPENVEKTILGTIENLSR